MGGITPFMRCALLCLSLAVTAFAGTPFTIEASEDVSADFPGAPRLQSFSFAQWDGRWVFIGGRTAGYHAAGGATAEFLQKDANRDVWVVDTKVQPPKTYHIPLSTLPDSLAAVRNQWGATAQLYTQDGPALYIAGGYGQQQDGKWTTFPILSRVDLPRLIDGVIHGTISADAIQFTTSPLVRSTGGGLIKLSDESFYLVMGHVFEGNYTVFEGQNEKNSSAASQEYLNEIRKLQISSSEKGLQVKLVETFRDEDQFHRRDLNVAHTLSPQGLGLAAYGGVFTSEQLNYSKPIYIAQQGKPILDHTTDQHLNAYTCATLLMYDASSASMYTTFFGSIGRYQWDAMKSAFIENVKTGEKADAVYYDGLQWSDQISTLVRHGSATDEFAQANTLPGYVGADAVFIANPSLPKAAPDTDILDITKLQGRTFVGYIYGGIKASPYQFPYTKNARPYTSGSAPTVVSNSILKVYVVRTQ
jgi:hypothetical protein